MLLRRRQIEKMTTMEHMTLKYTKYWNRIYGNQWTTFVGKSQFQRFECLDVHTQKKGRNSKQIEYFFIPEPYLFQSKIYCIFIQNQEQMETNSADMSGITSSSESLADKQPLIALNDYNDYLQQHLQALSQNRAFFEENNSKKMPKIFTVSHIINDPFIQSHIKPQCGSLNQFISDASIFNSKDLASQKKRRNEQGETDEETEEKKLRRQLKSKKIEELTKIFSGKHSSELQKSVTSKLLIQSIFKQQFGTSLKKFQADNSLATTQDKNKGVYINLDNIDEIFKGRSIKEKQNSRERDRDRDESEISKMNKSWGKYKSRNNESEFKKSGVGSNQMKGVSFFDYDKNLKNSSSNSRLAKVGSNNFRRNSGIKQTLISSSKKFFPDETIYESRAFLESKINIHTLNELSRSNPSISQDSYAYKKKQTIEQIKSKYPSFRKLRITSQSVQFEKLLNKQKSKYLKNRSVDEYGFDSESPKKVIEEAQEINSKIFNTAKSIETANEVKTGKFVFKVFPMLDQESELVLSTEKELDPVIEIVDAVLKPQVILYIVSHHDLGYLRTVRISSCVVSDETLAFFMQCLAIFGSSILQTLRFTDLRPSNNSASGFSTQLHKRQYFAQSLKILLQTKSIDELEITKMNLSSKEFCIICLGIITNENIRVIDFSNNVIDESASRTLELILKHCENLSKIKLSGNFLQAFHLRRFLENYKTKVIL